MALLDTLARRKQLLCSSRACAGWNTGVTTQRAFARWTAARSRCASAWAASRAWRSCSSRSRSPVHWASATPAGRPTGSPAMPMPIRIRTSPASSPWSTTASSKTTPRSAKNCSGTETNSYLRRTPRCWPTSSAITSTSGSPKASPSRPNCWVRPCWPPPARPTAPMPWR